MPLQVRRLVAQPRFLPGLREALRERRLSCEQARLVAGIATGYIRVSGRAPDGLVWIFGAREGRA